MHDFASDYAITTLGYWDMRGFIHLISLSSLLKERKKKEIGAAHVKTMKYLHRGERFATSRSRAKPPPEAIGAFCYMVTQ
jgi:hypothetical protein